MRRRAIIGALLLIGLGAVLGTTVFRTDIAQATGLAQSVTVDNTAANPVPVTAASTLPVHEQGSTQLLFHDRVRVTDPSPVVDVAGAREIRLYISTSLSQCPASIGVDVVEGGDAFLLDHILPTCGFTDTRLYEVPGRTLRLGFTGFVDRFADVAIYGRTN
jgi:hypothetical protein